MGYTSKLYIQMTIGMKIALKSKKKIKYIVCLCGSNGHWHSIADAMNNQLKCFYRVKINVSV